MSNHHPITKTPFIIFPEIVLRDASKVYNIFPYFLEIMIMSGKTIPKFLNREGLYHFLPRYRHYSCFPGKRYE